MMSFASIERIIAPQAIHFPEAIAVAVVGLVVNIACALILGQVEAHHDHAKEPHGVMSNISAQCFTLLLDSRS
jgi:Co/Zn/Cd efflux system component